MTTLTMPSAASEPQYSPGPLRFVAVHVNLLPDEIIDSRKSGRIKRYVIIGLGGLLALLLLVYGFTVWQTSRAKDDLADRHARTLVLQRDLHKYDELTLAQQQAKAIDQALATLMAGDLQWKGMLDSLRADAPTGVTITSINGSLAGADKTTDGKGGLGVLNRTGKVQVGSVTITGTATNKEAVAGYVDALSQRVGLAAPFPASITDNQGVPTFSVSVIITSDALSGRYAVNATDAGGAAASADSGTKGN